VAVAGGGTAKPKPPAPAPAPTKKSTVQVGGALGGASSASAVPGYHIDASGNYVSDTTGQALLDPTTGQPLSATAGTDPNTQATIDFLNNLGSTGVGAWNPNMTTYATPAQHQAALSAWQHKLVDAGLIPPNQPVTFGFYDDYTIKMTQGVMQFGRNNGIADPTTSVGELGKAYKSVAAATSSADPALLAAERALRRAQLPLDWNDLNRRIASQPLLDAELQRKIREQPVLDAELARRIAEQPLLDAELARKQAVEAALPQQTADKLLTEARTRWWIPLSQQAALDWGTRITKGTASEEDFTQWAQGQAGALFPQIKQYIDRGAQTSTLMDPYLQIAAKELDKNPGTLIGDTRIFGPNFMDQNGVLPDTNTYLQKLRTLPEWRTTTSANNLANDWSAKLSETFGGVAGIASGPLTQP
jgi:hypothetical protein